MCVNRMLGLACALKQNSQFNEVYFIHLFLKGLEECFSTLALQHAVSMPCMEIFIWFSA